MSFLRWVSGLSLSEWMRSPDIRRELAVEPLQLFFNGGQMRRLGRLARMPPGLLPLEVQLGGDLEVDQELAEGD